MGICAIREHKDGIQINPAYFKIKIQNKFYWLKLNLCEVDFPLKVLID